MGNEAQLLAVMIGYMSLLILWGVYQGRGVKNQQDYAIAGRKLPGWVAALSERATGESSWALLGLPGAAYATGLTEIWTAIGCVAGILTAWIAIAWRMRNEAEKFDATTFTDYISKRHNDKDNVLRMIAGATIVFFFFFYVGAQFLGGGKTLHTMFHIDPKLGMLITAAVIVPYTIYGGFRSVVYTDVIQAIIMIITLIAGPIVGVIYIANHPGMFATSIDQALRMAGPEYISLTGAAGGFGAGIVIVGGFSWFFGYLGGQPQLTTRFMAIRNPKQVVKARNIGIAWTVIAYIGALMLGWIGIAIFGPTGLENREFVMPKVILEIFPPAIAAILITGAIAAMISTADSLLIFSSTELSESLFGPWAKKKKLKISGLLFSRVITALLAGIALIIAWISGEGTYIFTLVSYVWSGIGGTFSIVILYTLFWKRYHRTAAIITILVGLTFTIFWISSGLEEWFTSRILTFVVAGITGLIATFILPSPAGRSGNE
ncbi:MAG: sodium/proline symporter [Bacteroidales bacterium]